jgi:signal recognition particle subunit SRP54
MIAVAFEGLADKLAAAFKKLKSKGKLTEADVKEAMRDVRLALLEADVNFKITKDFVAKVTERAVGSGVLDSLTPGQQVIKIVNEELTALMGGQNARINFASKPPTVVMLCGLQGSGKTTHAAKIAAMFKRQSHRPLLVACDVYRPAAIKQLQVVGDRAGVPVFEMGEGDPVKIAKAAVNHAKDHGNDLVIIDTAGRLHIDEVLMEELKKIKATVEPDEILLVVDAMTGQDAVNVASSFNEALGITGVILTKLDGDTRGGAALSVRAVTGRPVKLVGTGEKLEDIEPFYPDRMASRILGMGDMLTLIDKAQQDFDEKKNVEMAKKLKSNSMDFNDYLDMMQQVKKMGPLKNVIGMLPGGLGSKIKEEDLGDSELQLKRTEAIIQSMSKREREKPEVISSARKRRIAAGSGTRVEDVNKLLKTFEQTRKLMKQMGGMQKMKHRPFMPF